MKYGFVVTSGNAHEIIDLATEIEGNGWDGFFTWDGIGGNDQVFDPWAILAAASMRTERITLGAMIFPLSRRRPWKVAYESLTVDHLSNGRLVIPVGLGAIDNGGYANVQPEVTDRRVRAELLDESLEILNQAWSGEPFSYAGNHYQVNDLLVRPRPVQQPRIPIWTVGAWPYVKSMARAARWDGIIVSVGGYMDSPTPDQIREVVSWIAEHRTSDAPFDVVLEGTTSGDDREFDISRLAPYKEAGVTWWIESMWEDPHDVETLRRRIRQGPPRA